MEHGPGPGLGEGRVSLVTLVRGTSTTRPLNRLTSTMPRRLPHSWTVLASDSHMSRTVRAPRSAVWRLSSHRRAASEKTPGTPRRVAGAFCGRATYVGLHHT